MLRVHEAGRVASVVRAAGGRGGGPGRLAGTEMVQLPCARMISARTARQEPAGAQNRFKGCDLSPGLAARTPLAGAARAGGRALRGDCTRAALHQRVQGRRRGALCMESLIGMDRGAGDASACSAWRVCGGVQRERWGTTRQNEKNSAQIWREFIRLEKSGYNHGFASEVLHPVPCALGRQERKFKSGFKKSC